MKEAAIYVCYLLSPMAFALYFLLFIALWAKVLKETKAFKVAIGVLFTLIGLGVILAGILSGHPFGGHDDGSRFMVGGYLALIVSGGFFIFTTLSRTGKENPKGVPSGKKGIR